jgi:hypothetical protein
MTAAEYTAPPWLDVTDASRMRIDIDAGELVVKVVAPYRLVTYTPRKAADIQLDLAEATIVVKPSPGNAERLFKLYEAAFHFGIVDQITRMPAISLVPTVSLVGANAANARVDELVDFEARAGHVGTSDQQALFVAFDVVPGCKGIIEDVKHFIGPHDYGVIHDEYVVQRVFHHKWNRGGFDRELAVSNVVQLHVKRDGRDQVEDALVKGRMLLDTLDAVALEVDDNTRKDTLRLGGSAHVTADTFTLRDGTVVGRDRADLGPDETTIWGVRIAPEIGPTLSGDLELRDFQMRARADGMRHISRPFRWVEVARPEYVRTEAVRKRYFVLGILY